MLAPQLPRNVASPFGMGVEVEIDRVDAVNAIPRCTVKYSFIVRDDEPDVGAAIVLSERQRREQVG